MTGTSEPIDQGIRYELYALVAAPAVLASVAAAHRHARVALLEQGLALVPVTADLAGSLDDSGDPVPPETGFRALSAGLHGLLVAASAAGPIAYVEADYLGHDGRQTAAVWHRGAVVDGPWILGAAELFPRDGGAPISAVLRRLGVVATGQRDEFVVVGMSRHRRTRDWVTP